MEAGIGTNEEYLIQEVMIPTGVTDLRVSFPSQGTYAMHKEA
jgi:hypothetical protein